jgi:O-succinylbenzoic acid--CoA ligase
MRKLQPFSRSGSSVVNELQLVCGGETWTVAELRAEAHAWASFWSEHTDLAGAPFAALDVPLTRETVTAIWTLMELGIPFVPLHPNWPESHRRAVTARSGAVWLPTSRRPPKDGDAKHPDTKHPDAAREAFARLRRPVDDESPLALVFTSGTTGEPKGALLSHRAFWSSAHSLQAALGPLAKERWHLSLPLAHVGGLSVLTRTAALGGTIVLPPLSAANDATRPKPAGFDPHAFVEHCSSANITTTSLVPTQLERLVSARVPAPACSRYVLLGGAAAPRRLRLDAHALGWPIYRTYGMTETCSHVAVDRHPTHLDEIPLSPGVNARVDADGRLCLQTECLYSGYLDAAPHRSKDWFTTSDLATVTKEGVIVLGRADDVVISGGENIHPTEVESVLTTAPGVRAACVFARHSDVWGQELCAALVVGTDFDPDDISAYLREQLPSFKIPKAWVLLSALPTSSSGKISRRLCADLHSHACKPLLSLASRS